MFSLPPDESATSYRRSSTRFTLNSRYSPIRGLLQKREHLKSRGEKLGPAYLIFGSRCIEEGLFHEEINLLVKKKVLGKVYMCYSREPGQEKEYTSDKLRGDRVGALLGPVLRNSTTHVFICGSANMAEESKASLAFISSNETMEIIKAEGRMHEDVFGAVTSSSPAAADLNEENCDCTEASDSAELDSSISSDDNFYTDCLNQSYHVKKYLS